jgi:hypothetical protein
MTRHLATALRDALDRGAPSELHALDTMDPVDERDALLTLLHVYDVWMAPLSLTDGREVWQNHPALAAVKWRLDHELIDRLDERGPRQPEPVDAVDAIRRVAAIDLVPPVYDWLAHHASWPELVRFLALEGGPDGGFDDLVAVAQVGIRGVAKVALAANYWDEMGRGNEDDVHTALHDTLVDAIDLPRTAREDLPVSALERAALGGLLATNRHLQPEMLGALGLIELQAGPRCRAVVRALTRLGAPQGAFPFYVEHAQADPRHGKDWLQRVVRPLVDADAAWGRRMVRGAHWRHLVNQRFFDDAFRHGTGAFDLVRDPYGADRTSATQVGA